MQRMIVAAVAVGIALFAAFAKNDGSLAGAAMPTPTPAALQYEEVSRFVIGQATPPPPGSFSEDRAAAIAAAQSTPAPAHGLFAGLQNTANQALGAMHALQAGVLTRYTYYNNWERTDDVARQTAVIIKCDLHQYISLDLAHHTYRLTTTVPPQPQTPSVPGGANGPAAPMTSEPGTMDLTVGGNRQNLGPMTIEGIATQGQSGDVSVAMTNATGSCKNGNFSLGLTEYISNIHVAHPHCPVPHGNVPVSPQEFGTHSIGCTPRVHGNASLGGSFMNSSDRLVMYRLMMAGAGQANGHPFKSVTEAGNVQWLGKADAATLFEIPAGFTQQQ